jgi:hypothetical protein
MTREQKDFIISLEVRNYNYEIEGDKIVVTYYRDVELEYLDSLPPGVEFKNGGYVWLNTLKSIPPGVKFNNSGSVLLKSIVGGYFQRWTGNIEGVDNKRLLNFMISKGMFI